MIADQSVHEPLNHCPAGHLLLVNDSSLENAIGPEGVGALSAVLKDVSKLSELYLGSDNADVCNGIDSFSLIWMQS